MDTCSDTNVLFTVYEQLVSNGNCESVLYFSVYILFRVFPVLSIPLAFIILLYF